ncbi:co-chaperone GroES [Mycoplasmoides pirum]|uniref:co-chaperone GroES n=1 Tax=Mycoplasmoides pirum TaxID=2122 RepID=UPI00055FEBC0|nr:co-chaperone GroES [Mycoplasmoides pirum]
MIKPLHDNVLIEPLNDEIVSKKGIILTTNSEENTNTTKGVVVALGDGQIYKSDSKCNFEIQVGDVVFFKEYSGTNIVSEDGKNLKILSYEDIVAVQK